MEEMRTEERTERAEGRLSVLNLFTFRPLRWQLISIIVLMAGQQLSGINAVRGGTSPKFLVPLGLNILSLLHFDFCKAQSSPQVGGAAKPVLGGELWEIGAFYRSGCFLHNRQDLRLPDGSVLRCVCTKPEFDPWDPHQEWEI